MYWILGRIWVDTVTRISVLMLLASVSVIIILSIVSVLILLTGICFGALTLICTILMVELISKVPVKMGSILEWYRSMSRYIFSMVSKITYIEGLNMRELVVMWLTFKAYKCYLKGSHLALEMFQF